MKSQPPLGQRIFYRVVRAVVLTPIKVAFRVRVRGRNKAPRRGAYIVAPSHRSLMDIFFTGFITRRRIRFMGKEELFKNRVLAWVFTRLGGFPVERGAADRTALRAAQTALEGGEPVAIYPEGTRHEGPVIETLFDGPCFLAARLGIPVVPVAVAGSEQILPSGKTIPRPHRVVIVVGDPIEPPKREGRVRRNEVAQMTEQLRVELQQRFDEALALAGVPGRSDRSASEVGEHE